MNNKIELHIVEARDADPLVRDFVAFFQNEISTNVNAIIMDALQKVPEQQRIQIAHGAAGVLLAASVNILCSSLSKDNLQEHKKVMHQLTDRFVEMTLLEVTKFRNETFN